MGGSRAIRVVCDADPATELDLDLYYADAGVGWANPNLIDVLDTTNGVFTEDTNANFISGNPIPNGKKLYLQFGAEPDANITQMFVRIEGYAEED